MTTTMMPGSLQVSLSQFNIRISVSSRRCASSPSPCLCSCAAGSSMFWHDGGVAATSTVLTASTGGSDGPPTLAVCRYLMSGWSVGHICAGGATSDTSDEVVTYSCICQQVQSLIILLHMLYVITEISYKTSKIYITSSGTSSFDFHINFSHFVQFQNLELAYVLHNANIQRSRSALKMNRKVFTVRGTCIAKRSLSRRRNICPSVRPSRSGNVSKRRNIIKLPSAKATL